MPIVNGDYQQLTAEQIQETLETELQQEFGQDIDLTESSVFTTLANVVASVTSQNQEQSLQEVYQSAFLDTATGIDLDRVVSIIGIQRRDAIHATGVQRFVASGPVAQDYTIQSGTVVQTDSDAPAQFETTEPTVLTLVDSFESQDLSVYAGDTTAASIVTDPDAVRGDYVLELDDTDGAHIYRDDAELQRGTTYHGWVNPSNSTAPALTFAVQPTNPQNYYQIVADGAANQVRLERRLRASVVGTTKSSGIGRLQRISASQCTGRMETNLAHSAVQTTRTCVATADSKVLARTARSGSISTRHRLSPQISVLSSAGRMATLGRTRLPNCPHRPTVSTVRRTCIRQRAQTLSIRTAKCSPSEQNVRPTPSFVLVPRRPSLVAVTQPTMRWSLR